MSSESEHEWFKAQIATYLSQGLSDPAERQRFESHARACEACAEEYQRFQQMEGTMSDLFAGAMPDANFEQRILSRLRLSVSSHRRKIPPIVRNAAIAAAAAMVVGGIGLVGKDYVNRGELPQFALGLPQLDRAREVSHLSRDLNVAKALQYSDAESLSANSDGDGQIWNANGGVIGSKRYQLGASGGAPLFGDGHVDAKYTDANTLSNKWDYKGAVNENGPFGQPASATYSGSIGGSNSMRIVKIGSGTQQLAGNGDYAGERVVTSGTLNVGGGGGGRGGPQVTVAGGGKLDVGGNVFRQQTAGAEGAGATTLFGAPRENADRTQGAQRISGNSTIVINGGGTLSIGAGGVALRNDTNGTTIMGSGGLKLNGPLNNNQGTLVSGNIPNGNLTKAGTASLKLDGVSVRMSGDLSVNQGTLAIADAEKKEKSFKPSEFAMGGDPTHRDYFYQGDSVGLSVSGGSFDLNGHNQTINAQAGESGSDSKQHQDDSSKVVQLQYANGKGVAPLINDLLKNDPSQTDGIAAPQYAQASNLETGIPRDVAERLARESQATTQPAQVGVATNAAPAVAPVVRHVIRSGSMEFEVDSYDSAYVTITKITAEEGGFVEAADSDKLPNGKVRGNVTVRVPPDNLDTLVMKLRALGDLKNQKLGSTDIGKEYTDLESELRAAKAMESRLLDMIKTAQGKVADLLEAEKELGNWRTKIEKIQGQLNYYNNLTSMATLTISAYERDIRTPASASEMEEINAGVETEDVETARTAAIKAIDDVKGRIIESTLQKLEAGQFAAKIVAEVAPENAGPLVDRLKQLGRVSRLDIQRKQTTENAKPQAAGQAPLHVEQAPTRLIISMYNLANVAPRLTTNLNLASDDVEGIYRAILKRVNDASGRVISSNLNRQDATQIVGAMQFEVKAADADAVLNDIRKDVQVLRFTVTENPDTANVTTAKQAVIVQIVPLSSVSPRLTTNLNLAASDVESSYRAILKRVTDAGGRVISSNLNRQDATQAVGSMQFELKTEQADAVRNDITKGVQVLQLTVNENPDTSNVTTAKQVFVVQIIPTTQVAPRETRTLAVETSEVESAMQNLTSAVASAGGRVLGSNLTQDANGRMTAQLALEVPLDKADALVDVAKGQGKVRTSESSKNTQVPEGPLARARLNLTIGSGETIVAASDGFWPRLRQGLGTSINGLLWSFELIVIGLCLIGPWVLLLWGGWRFARRNRRMKAEG